MTKFPSLHSVVRPKALIGSLQLNSQLDGAEKLFEGKLDSPEDLKARNGVIYASLRDNRVVKITKGKVETLTDFGTSCCE